MRMRTIDSAAFLGGLCLVADGSCESDSRPPRVQGPSVLFDRRRRSPRAAPVGRAGQPAITAKRGVTPRNRSSTDGSAGRVAHSTSRSRSTRAGPSSLSQRARPAAPGSCPTRTAARNAGRRRTRRGVLAARSATDREGPGRERGAAPQDRRSTPGALEEHEHPCRPRPVPCLERRLGLRQGPDEVRSTTAS